VCGHSKGKSSRVEVAGVTVAIKKKSADGEPGRKCGCLVKARSVRHLSIDFENCYLAFLSILSVCASSSAR
jgi:hypothetical protein